MTLRSIILAAISLILLSVLASEIAWAKAGLVVAEIALAEQGIDIPDLLGPLSVWTQGETTLKAILENPEAQVIYQEASRSYDLAFPAALGGMITLLLFLVPTRVWPKRVQMYDPRLIQIAPMIGLVITGIDNTENFMINEYLNGGWPPAILGFQVASTMKWLLITGSVVLILGVYARWVRQIVKDWRNRPTA